MLEAILYSLNMSFYPKGSNLEGAHTAEECWSVNQIGPTFASIENAAVCQGGYISEDVNPTYRKSSRLDNARGEEQWRASGG